MKKLLALLILILTQPQAFALTLEQFYQSDDGNNYLPAYQRLVQSPECVSGCRIDLGCRSYPMGDTLKVCKPMKITGCGQRVSFLTFPSAKTGIHLGYGQCDATDPGGASSVLEDFGVNSGGEVKPTADNPADYVMIEVKTGTITIRNVRTTGGRHGIRIDAGTTRPGVEKSNANHWRLDGVSAYNTHHSPIYIKGPDSNAGTATATSAVNGCKYASTLKALSIADPVKFPVALQQCGGIHDQSFLGNIWIGSHTADIRDDVDHSIGYPGYLSIGDNQHVTFLGSYTEQDSLCGQVSARSWAQGGITCFKGAGLYYNTNTASNIILQTPTITTPTLGLDAATGFQRLMIFRFPGAEKISYLSWDYDQRHRADGVTPTYAPGHDSLTWKINGSNPPFMKWTFGVQP